MLMIFRLDAQCEEVAKWPSKTMVAIWTNLNFVQLVTGVILFKSLNKMRSVKLTESLHFLPLLFTV